MVTCLLRFDDDVRGLLDVNWLTPEKQRELVVVGEGGMLRASYLTQDVWFIESTDSAAAWIELATIRGDSEGSAIRFALRRVEPIRAELEAFLACIIDDTTEPVTAYDGARALAAALGVLESASERRPVEITQIVPPRTRRRVIPTTPSRRAPLVEVA
jgi:predicted dehydrogenase